MMLFTFQWFIGLNKRISKSNGANKLYRNQILPRQTELLFQERYGIITTRNKQCRKTKAKKNANKKKTYNHINLNPLLVSMYYKHKERQSIRIEPNSNPFKEIKVR